MGLVLTRTVGQRVILLMGDDKIEIEVAQIKGKQVRLNFENTNKAVIHRAEVADKYLNPPESPPKIT